MRCHAKALASRLSPRRLQSSSREKPSAIELVRLVCWTGSLGRYDSALATVDAIFFPRRRNNLQPAIAFKVRIAWRAISCSAVAACSYLRWSVKRGETEAIPHSVKIF